MKWTEPNGYIGYNQKDKCMLYGKKKEKWQRDHLEIMVQNPPSLRERIVRSHKENQKIR